jgi:hypothetical protein
MRRLLTFVFLSLTIVSINVAEAFSQGGNGTLTGSVEDASKALIPGVTITATNKNTAVTSSTVSNESGGYNIPSLLPGVYRLSATLPGFQTQTFDNIELGNETKRFNFAMQVANVATNVEVSIDAATLLTTQGANVGEVLTESKVRDLPLVTGDVLDLVRIMPGVRSTPGGGVFDSFAGLSTSTVNTVRDGLSVTDGRYDNGIYASTTINPELVGEIRLILTPVDAEMGRGNGQVQITTRSGTNKYTGSAVWNVRNTALNANTWENNRDFTTVGGVNVWAPTPADWFNENQVTLTYGGPIFRNKTFFFAQYDKQFRNQRSIVTGLTMTDTAKQGIFRYWDGWNNGNASQASPSNTGTTIAAIDFGGALLRPFRNQGQAGYDAWIAAGGNPNNPYAVSTYTGSLRCVSVFGNTKADGSPFTAADCPGGSAVFPSGGGAWDPNRPVIDPTGFIRKFLNFMPTANFYQSGDGLNTAAIRYLRGNNANQGGIGGTVGLQTGQNINANRDQINIKVDQNFSSNHKLSVGYTYEVSGGADAVGFWPNQFTGETKRKPHVLTSNFTSTISSTLLNEARFGIRITQTNSVGAWDHTAQEVRDGAREFFVYGNKSLYSDDSTPIPVIFAPGNGIFRWEGDNAPFEPTFNPIGNYNPLYNFADTVRWTFGQHALRLGGDLRLTRSKGFNQNPIPVLTGGAGNLPGSATNIFASTETGGITGMTTGSRDNTRNLLYFMAGSIGGGSMNYWINSPDDVSEKKWEDYATAGRRYREQRNHEYAAFFQDDWKLTRNLTLNLGLRYEYYGVPHLKGGFTTTAINQGAGLFGVARLPDDQLFNNWLYPGGAGAAPIFLSGYGPSTAPANQTAATALQCTAGTANPNGIPASSCDPSKLTLIEFIGPDTPNPEKSIWNPDRNNFGPVFGFSWQVPFIGERTATLRGGYSITYGGSSANGIALDGILGGAPGATNAPTLSAAYLAQFPEHLDLTDLPKLVPITPSLVPGGFFHPYGKSGAFTAYNPGWETPYSQNFNLSFTTNLTRRITFDTRYVGTRGNKLSGTLNLNEVNVFNNTELFNALETVRRGGEAPLFDQMFAGLNLNAGIAGTTGKGNFGFVGTTNTAGVLQTGSMHLRRWQRTNLAAGNYEAIASALNGNVPGVSTTNGVMNPPTGLAGTVGGTLLRNGCNRMAAGLTTVNTPSGPQAVRCFPENYLVTNPQFGSANFVHNGGYSNFHSMQTQVTLRPMFGVSGTATYAWQKLMSLGSSGHRDLRNRALDYTLGTNHNTHDFRMNGQVELPIGPNKLLLGSTSGWIARVVERWQTSFIFNWFSGRPVSITGQQTMWGGSNPDVVGPWTVRAGTTQWGKAVSATQTGGNFFHGPNGTNPFIKVQDPQCRPGGPLDATDAMGTNLTADPAAYCTLDALARADTGEILLQNAQPGKLGTLGLNTFSTRGVWTLDGNLSKTFQVNERISAQLRIDASNILNHPIPNDPQVSINSNTPFGDQIGKSAFQPPRAFRATLRLAF